MKFPPEWPGVICGECGEVCELTDMDVEWYIPGIDGYDGELVVEFPSWSVVLDSPHGVLNPIPLTPEAKCRIKELWVLAAK